MSPWIGALRQCLCYKPACVQRKVTVVLTANTYTSRSGEHTDLIILKIQIAKLHSSISTPLRTFSAQFAIDNGTFATDNFQERLHWWGTTSSCYGTCPSVPQLGYTTVENCMYYTCIVSWWWVVVACSCDKPGLLFVHQVEWMTPLPCHPKWACPRYILCFLVLYIRPGFFLPQTYQLI